MQKILENILKNLPKNILIEIDQKLNSFKELNKKDNSFWFSELCFCILTANSKASSAINIQIEIQPEGFAKKTETDLSYIIKKHGHRFHNTKAKYICAARNFISIKDMLQNLTSQEARFFLVNNIKGIGYKEASHFLRNVGYCDVAIIDRHILRFMHQNNLITSIPKTIKPKTYLEFEEILKKFKTPLDQLDLILWAHMTGKVLK